MVTSETTTLTLQHSAAGVEVMKKIVEYFGGWIDEIDDDDTSFYPVFPEPEHHNTVAAETEDVISNNSVKFWISEKNIRFEKEEDCKVLAEFLKRLIK